MSEEEIIKYAEETLNYDEDKKHNRLIEDLLDLYKKGKQRNKILEQEREYLNCIIESDKDNYISKDKIKAKIESVDYSNHCKAERIAMKEILQSLLEKEN